MDEPLLCDPSSIPALVVSFSLSWLITTIIIIIIITIIIIIIIIIINIIITIGSSRTSLDSTAIDVVLIVFILLP